MVVSGVKMEGAPTLNPYRRGMDAPTYSEPVPRVIEERPQPVSKNWRGHSARPVRYIPTGDVFKHGAVEAADATGYSASTVRWHCSPGYEGERLFEYGESENRVAG